MKKPLSKQGTQVNVPRRECASDAHRMVEGIVGKSLASENLVWELYGQGLQLQISND